MGLSRIYFMNVIAKGEIWNILDSQEAKLEVATY